MKLGQIAKFIDPSTSPQKLTALATNHFPAEVRSAVIIAKPNSFKDAIQLLKELQRNMTNNLPRIAEPRVASGKSTPRRVEASVVMQEELARHLDVSSGNRVPPMATNADLNRDGENYDRGTWN